MITSCPFKNRIVISSHLKSSGNLRSCILLFFCFCKTTLSSIPLILSSSLIAKYVIEKYSEKYTGRKITMDRAYVNPLTGYFHLSNLKIYEHKSDSIFISIEGLSANLNLNPEQRALFISGYPENFPVPINKRL